MWFKQVQVIQLSGASSLVLTDLVDKLEALAFRPCLASLPESIGWVSPVDEENMPLVRSVNGAIMLCMQIEEKVLPAAVIRQELNEVVRQLETSESRKLRQKEKNALKDQVTSTLLLRAFSKLTRVYGYIDTVNNWLVLSTTSTKLTEKFMSLFKKSVDVEVGTLDLKNVSSIMTQWLKTKNYPTIFNVEKSCVLQDPNQENRMIRCQQQDLFANGIQSLMTDGCEVIQLALSWQDRVDFVLANDFSLRSIRFRDEVIAQSKEMEPETKQQQFDADFIIMSAAFGEFLKELAETFCEQYIAPEKQVA